MAGGNPAVLPVPARNPREQASASTAVDEENLEDRVRSLRLSSIPQGGDWFRSLVLLIVGVGFLGLLYYLIRETLKANPGAAAPGAVATAAKDSASGSSNADKSNALASGNGAANATSAQAGRGGNTAHEAQG